LGDTGRDDFLEKGDDVRYPERSVSAQGTE